MILYTSLYIHYPEFLYFVKNSSYLASVRNIWKYFRRKQSVTLQPQNATETGVTKEILGACGSFHDKHRGRTGPSEDKGIAVILWLIICPRAQVGEKHR